MRTDVPLQIGEVKNGSFRAGARFVVSALLASLCGNGRCADLEADPRLVSTASSRTRWRRVPLDGVELLYRQTRDNLASVDIAGGPPSGARRPLLNIGARRDARTELLSASLFCGVAYLRPRSD